MTDRDRLDARVRARTDRPPAPESPPTRDAPSRRCWIETAAGRAAGPATSVLVPSPP